MNEALSLSLSLSPSTFVFSHLSVILSAPSLSISSSSDFLPLCLSLSISLILSFTTSSPCLCLVWSDLTQEKTNTCVSLSLLQSSSLYLLRSRPLSEADGGRAGQAGSDSLRDRAKVGV